MNHKQSWPVITLLLLAAGCGPTLPDDDDDDTLETTSLDIDMSGGEAWVSMREGGSWKPAR